MVGFQPRRVEKPCSRGVLHFGSEDSVCVQLWRKEHLPQAKDFLKFVGVWRMKRAVEGIRFIMNMSGMESSVKEGESSSRSPIPTHSWGSAWGEGSPGWWWGADDKPAGAICAAGTTVLVGRERWGCLVPLPGLQLCLLRGKGFSEQHQAALAHRCLRISSLPAVRRQVSAPSANKLGPDPGDCAFPLGGHRERYMLCKGIFPPQSRARPHIYPRAQNLWLHFPFFFNSLYFTEELPLWRTVCENCQK